MFKSRDIPHLDWIPVIIISLLLYKLIDDIHSFPQWIGRLLSLFSYFIWAFVIAYLLNPMMVYLEKKFKLHRIWSITIIYSIFLGLLTIAATFLAPRVVKNTGDLLQNLPNFLQNTQSWLESEIYKNKLFEKYNLYTYLAPNLDTVIEKANQLFRFALNMTVSQLINLTSGFLKLFTGIVISIYMLKDKEKFLKNSKRFIFSVLQEKNAVSFLNLADKINIVCLQFIVGKSVDSIIIGLLCFAGLIVLKIPYVLLISVFFALTNMIPYFGNLIGMVPACIITFLYSPIKALIVFIFLAVLSQFDAWFLSPKILGKRVGLSPLWVLLGITIGGELFGILGMFLGVPLMAVIKTFLEEFISKRLLHRNVQNLE